MKTNLSASQIQIRKFFFAMFVADHFATFGCYPAFSAMRGIFGRATLAALRKSRYV